MSEGITVYRIRWEQQDRGYTTLGRYIPVGQWFWGSLGVSCEQLFYRVYDKIICMAPGMAHATYDVKGISDLQVMGYRPIGSIELTVDPDDPTLESAATRTNAY